MTPNHTRTLILAYPADNYLEVYADRQVDIHVAVPIRMDTPAGEALADEYLDETLPVRFRDLHDAPHLRAVHTVRAIRPSDEAERLLRVDLIREARAIAGEPEEALTWML